jgi:hypothetical protein
MSQYFVHIYHVVRTKISIEADDHVDAMKKAVEFIPNIESPRTSASRPTASSRATASSTTPRTRRRVVGYLVDEVGDEEYHNTGRLRRRVSAGEVMIFYRAVDGDGLVHWVTVGAEAKAIDREFKQIDIGTDKAALKELMNNYERELYAAKYLNTYSSAEPSDEPYRSPDDVDLEPAVAEQMVADRKRDDVPPPCPVQQSINLDEQFDELPLARQLHFAALAMENARERLPD